MSIKPDNAFLTGVIEGFYGRPWSFQTRLAYAAYLAQAGLNCYLYCPKSDPYLRKQWQGDWPGHEWQQLLALSAAFRNKGIYWGVGLSPFALYIDYGHRQREQLKRKVDRLSQLDAPLLAILFDDMPGDLDDLATRQAEIVTDVVSWLPGVRVLVCPTYYAFDPVLETFFGAMPKAYWARLGRELPPVVDIFWTGNKVCSPAISRVDIERINTELQRPVVLWDNYPVNDGAVRSNFLYLKGLSQRERLPSSLVSGHLCNPMNQGMLSLPALAGLAALYDTGDVSEPWLQDVIGKGTWQLLQQHQSEFEELGLSGMGEKRCLALARCYQALPGQAALEVAQWLAGDYRFDPACLTD